MAVAADPLSSCRTASAKWFNRSTTKNQARRSTGSGTTPAAGPPRRLRGAAEQRAWSRSCGQHGLGPMPLGGEGGAAAPGPDPLPGPVPPGPPEVRTSRRWLRREVFSAMQRLVSFELGGGRAGVVEWRGSLQECVTAPREKVEARRRMSEHETLDVEDGKVSSTKSREPNLRERAFSLKTVDGNFEPVDDLRVFGRVRTLLQGTKPACHHPAVSHAQRSFEPLQSRVEKR